MFSKIKHGDKILPPFKKNRWLFVGLMVLYIISPIDLLPDVIPVVGQLDDVVVLVLLIVQVIAGLKDKNILKTKEPTKIRPESDIIEGEILEE